MTEQPRKRASGAGLKTPEGVKDLQRLNVMIDPVNLAILKGVGLGNLSLGVREAARRLQEAGDTGPFSKSRHEARDK